MSKRYEDYLADALKKRSSISANWIDSFFEKARREWPDEEPNESMVPLDYNLEGVLIAAMRYALGKQTPLSETVAVYITYAVPRLTNEEIAVLRRDLEEYMEANENLETHWNNLHRAIVHELKERRNGRGRGKT